MRRRGCRPVQAVRIKETVYRHIASAEARERDRLHQIAFITRLRNAFRRMYWLAPVLLFLLVQGATAAQEVPVAPTAKVAPCSTHSRHWQKPWTWTESNMCQADYDAWAQGEWRQKGPILKRPQFWLSEGFGIFLPIGIDVHTTINRPKNLIEANPLLGPHPTAAHAVEVGAALFVVESGFNFLAHKLMKNDPSRTWRFLGDWGVSGAVWGTSGQRGIRNYDEEGKL